MSKPLERSPIALITGPTAVGKTTLSVDAATRLNAEIVSADARQIYRGLDIGTAKPTPSELETVRHHFIDELDVDQSFSAGQFARAAEQRILDIFARGRIPLIVGGSTLYVDALVRGLSDIPDVEPGIRVELNARLASEGAKVLYEELKSVDPVSATTLDATKSQRIVRALEIYHGTGTPLSEFHTAKPIPTFTFNGIVLSRPREELYDRINSRVDQMLNMGLVTEVRSLLESGADPRRNALRTIGYREVVEHLSGGITYDEMVRLVKRNSRRYAKRQITWLRRYRSLSWVPASLGVDGVLAALHAD